VQLVHPLLNTPEELAILKARGVSYSTSPQLEARRASQLGEIQLGELLAAGVKVSLSTDHIASISCDPFASMRILFALHSHRIGAKVPLTLKRLLQLATIDGAVDLGIADRTGSITSGKRADLVLVRATDVNLAPAADPYETIVSFAMPANVDTVMVDGRVLRRGGKFTAVDHGRIVAEAREAALALRDKAKWPA
jgi:cytosine/adenosine deaminase-related metal-dependent hydrolase